MRPNDSLWLVSFKVTLVRYAYGSDRKAESLSVPVQRLLPMPRGSDAEDAAAALDVLYPVDRYAHAGYQVHIDDLTCTPVEDPRWLSLAILTVHERTLTTEDLPKDTE